MGQSAGTDDDSRTETHSWAAVTRLVQSHTHHIMNEISVSQTLPQREALAYHRYRLYFMTVRGSVFSAAVTFSMSGVVFD